jgi:hypothetical protein
MTVEMPLRGDALRFGKVIPGQSPDRAAFRSWHRVLTRRDARIAAQRIAEIIEPPEFATATAA